MKPEHKALIGKRCVYTGEYGTDEPGTIVDILESMVKPYDIILCCVKLDSDITPKAHYTVGCDRDEIEVLNDTDVSALRWQNQSQLQ